ncbi:hypothetical protein ACWGH2_07415 [Streptomyces sp. NPDC054871]
MRSRLRAAAVIVLLGLAAASCPGTDDRPSGSAPASQLPQGGPSWP